MENEERDLKRVYGSLLKLSLLLSLCICLFGFLAKKDVGLHPISIRGATADTLWMFPDEPPPNIEEPPPVERPRPSIQPAEPDDPEAVETIVTDSQAWNRPPHVALSVPEFTDVYEEEPVPVSKVTPVYPPLARLGKIEGTVYVIAYIDSTGKVVKAEIGSSVHESLDMAALEAVRQWSFRPAKMRDKPVAVIVGIPVEFRLK